MKITISIKEKILIFLLILLGTFFQSMTMVRSGLKYDFGLGFWGPNGHDGIWHIALSNQTMNNFPPDNPVFSGEKLTNYHFFYDLLLSFSSKITGLEINYFYFQIFPIAFSLLIGGLSFFVGYCWKKNYWTGFWLVFLNYFAGSFGYLITLFREGKIGGESMFWSMQSASTQINPPYSLSLIFILLGLLMLLKIEKLKLFKLILLGAIFGILINIKSYAGVICVGSFGLVAIMNYIFFHKKNITFVFFISSAIFLSLFLLTNAKADSLFVFKPFWFINSLFESRDRLYLPKVASAINTFQGSKAYFKLAIIEITGFFIFVLGNMGTRILGIFSIVKNRNKIGVFEQFILIGILIGIIIPTFFIQKGTSWNTVQFFYYSLFFMNIFTADFLSLQIKKLKIIILLVLVLLTIPTTYSTLKDYFGWPPPASLPINEMETLSYLSKQKTGNVLTFPFDVYKKNEYEKTPLPLFVYESTSYVSAYSKMTTYVDDYMNLDISGYDWKTRLEKSKKFFTTDDSIWARGFLLNNGIDYIYLTSSQKINFSDEQIYINKIYENNGTKIYKVIK
jgi:hypothetical protein